MKRPSKHPRYRAMLEKALVERAQAQEEWSTYNSRHPLNDEMGEAMQAAIKAKKSRAKISVKPHHRFASRWDFSKARKLLGEEAYLEIFTPFSERANAARKATEAKRERAKKKIEKVIFLAPLHPGEEWVLVDRISSSTYSTQPNKIGYARARAEIQCEHYQEEFPEIEFRVERLNQPSGDYVMVSFRIEAKVEGEVDVEILKAHFPAMETFVRKCWAKGVQPRVFFPHLPHDYEAKHGIDYFGRKSS